MKPTISVVVITYNQQATLAQTLDSILMQEGNFDLQIVVAEDCSTDNTRDICQQYKILYPEKIVLLLQVVNQGITKNFIDGLRACEGDYIAICAGDDYWIDPLKLQKQLHFLQSHLDYGVVSTNGYRLLVKQNKLVAGIPPLHPVADGRVFDQTWRGGVYAMPLAMMFRAELLNLMDLDEWLRRKFSVEDIPLQAIMAHNTKFGYIADTTCIYRVYPESATFISFNHPRYMYYHEGLVAIRKYLYELYPNEVEYSDQWANDYLVYRKFLRAIVNYDYKDACACVGNFRATTGKEARAVKVCQNRLTFYVFCIIKRLKLRFNK